MNLKMHKVINEMTTNFSDLFIEALYIRYLKEFPSADISEVLKLAHNTLNKKIQLKIDKKLKILGYKDKKTKKGRQAS